MTSRKDKEDLAVILTELRERGRDDPLRLFDPFAKQRQFEYEVLHGDNLENWYFGANRSGKSDIGAHIGATLARFGDQSENVKHVRGKDSNISIRDRSTSGWVVSLDFPSSRDIVQPKYFNNGHIPPGSSHEPFIPDREIAKQGWNKTDSVLKLKNGSLIGFKSADSGQQKFYGVEKDWIQFDEPPPKEIYSECVIRIGQRKLRVFGTCTLLPQQGVAGGVSWLFREKVIPWQEGDDRIGIFSVSIYENPFLGKEEIARLESLYPIGSLERRIRLEGELVPSMLGALVYASFDRKLHCSKVGEVDFRKPLCWLWDFNVSPMTTGVGQIIDDRFVIFKELWLESGSISMMTDLFMQHFPRHGAEIWIYGDATGKHMNHQFKMTSYQVVLNSMLRYPSPVKLMVPEINPPVPSRINAVNSALKGVYGEVGVEIDSDCKELVADLEQVLSDNRGGIKKVTKEKDPYYWRTHTSDWLGYWIAQEKPVVQIQEGIKSSKVKKIPRPGYSSQRKYA